MSLCAGVLRRSRIIALLFYAILAAAVISMSLGRPAHSAVVFELIAQDTGNAAFGAPFAVAADPLGNFYVVDTAKHRIVKFDDLGTVKKIFGSQGFGPGQFYYPRGVAVGEHRNGETLVYVADTANNRIAVFDDLGHYEGRFGIAGAGTLNNPDAVAFVKNPNAPGGFVLVADTRNHRVAVFTDNGIYERDFRCASCPYGGIRPLGIAARFKGPDNRLEMYVVDEFTSQVQVLNSGGGWVRSIGTRGTAPGQLQNFDDVAVDDEGNVWVVDSGFAAGSTERVSKFDRNGNFLFHFNSNGDVAFFSPKGLAIDQQGKLYVANMGGNDVYRFREEAPKLIAAPFKGDPYWVTSKGIWFRLAYNGLEQTCRAGGTATVRAPAGTAPAFTVDGGPRIIDEDYGPMKMDMTTQQTARVADAWRSGKEIGVVARLQARCQDGTFLQNTLTFTR